VPFVEDAFGILRRVPCLGCGHSMDGKRAHALTCSGACRKRLQRRRARGDLKGGQRIVRIVEVRYVPPVPVESEPVQVDPDPAF
jgi:hypothetical protein